MENLLTWTPLPQDFYTELKDTTPNIPPQVAQALTPCSSHGMVEPLGSFRQEASWELALIGSFRRSISKES